MYRIIRGGDNYVSLTAPDVRRSVLGEDAMDDDAMKEDAMYKYNVMIYVQHY